jgi:hypothetical protein
MDASDLLVTLGRLGAHLRSNVLEPGCKIGADSQRRRRAGEFALLRLRHQLVQSVLRLALRPLEGDVFRLAAPIIGRQVKLQFPHVRPARSNVPFHEAIPFRAL